MRRSFRQLFWVLFSLWAPDCLQAQEPAPPGLIVEKVGKGSGWERAGLQPGDVLRTWRWEADPTASSPSAQGSFQTPFELVEVVIERWPRGVVTLQGERSSQTGSWTLPRGSPLDWRPIQVAPALPASLQSSYSAGKARMAAGDFAAGAALWSSMASAAQARGERLLGAWLLMRLARSFVDAGKWPEADSAYGDALRGVSRPDEAWAAAHVLREWGDQLFFKDRERAGDCYRRALALDQQSERPRMAVAWDLLKLGRTAAERADPKAAEISYRQALAVIERLAPKSFACVHGQRYLGTLSFFSDPVASRQWMQGALGLLEELDPEAPERVWLLSDLGNLASEMGDLAGAEDYLQRALALEKKWRLTGAETAYTLNVLGYVAMNRGDLESAEDYLQQGLLLYENAARASPGSTANILTHLGWIAWLRGEEESAQRYLQRNLTTLEKLASVGGVREEMAQGLNKLGTLELKRGNVAVARKHFRAALDVYEQLSLPSLERAVLLGNLGLVEAREGDFAAADRSVQQALALAREKAPRSLYMADILSKAAAVLDLQGDRAHALERYRQALVLYEGMTPGSGVEASLLHDLGILERRVGQQAAGLEHLCRAVDTLDFQRTRLGGTDEARSAFEASHSDFYRDCAQALVEAGRPEQAFHVLERGRARFFLTLLAERDLRFSDLPPQLAIDRRRLDAEYDRTQAALFQLAAPESGEVERLQSRLREIQRQRQEMVARIRRESPRFAALQHPEPLALDRARAALDPGTVLLSYSIGRERSYLFVVRPLGVEGSGLSIFPLDVGRDELGAAIRTFQKRIKHRRSDRQGLTGQASSLYDLLLRPAEPLLTAGERLLISPDGPLHTLPFAALVRNGRYVVEWKPLHTVLSATVYAELREARSARGASTTPIVAFGAPHYPPATASPEESVTDLRVRSAVRRGLSLAPLPETRREVAGIAALYPRAEVYLGADATEERAKTVGRQARLLHFACHGLLDEQLPLNSALALAIPEKFEEGRDNGLLQAWEIFEQVRLDADLVTLSACDTALGKELGGEGLISLTRAFQYAGARSVLASLWAVPDAATSLLMPRVYGALREGRSKDEALRAAQIAQLRHRKYSHPFYWAAFQLVGDWR